MIQKVKEHLNVAKLFVNEIFGQNSDAKKQELGQWKENHKEVTEDIYNWDNFTQHQISASQIDTNKEWVRLGKELNKGNKTRLIIRYAAAAVILIATGLFYYYPTANQTEVVADIQQVIKENPKGVKSEIQLPDGTHVWLNSASSISYQMDFSDSVRLITLKGEAYFEVVKDPNRPFRVKSEGITTTALGTAFNVNAFKDDDIQVSLHEGKVRVAKENALENTILLPGQQANAGPTEFSVLEFDVEEVLAWKDGIIYFNNTDFDNMLSTLEKWYNVSFRIESLTTEKRKQIKVTGKFKNQTLVNVLKLLGHSMHFEYTIDQKIVTLRF
ncbi:FecR domain-containing protein [Reichenbachiella sp. MALMAid0571]|uniref:FecR family protein n=1 Tax=Reichenbachiella sp. MALMAid0571 TaxID=3143939 RepID=UPI0032DFB73B